MTSCITHETLAQLGAGDIGPEHIGPLHEHLEHCPACRKRLETQRKLHSALCLLPRMEPSTQALLDTRCLLSEEIRLNKTPEIMALDDVAQFLRIGPAELEEIAEELPAFELGGEIRIRRSRLIEWIEQREHQYLRQTVESRVARISRNAFQKGA